MLRELKVADYTVKMREANLMLQQTNQVMVKINSVIGPNFVKGSVSAKIKTIKI